MKPFTLFIDKRAVTCDHDDGCLKCGVKIVRRHSLRRDCGAELGLKLGRHVWESWFYCSPSMETRTCHKCRFMEARPQSHDHVFRGRARMVPYSPLSVSYGCECGVRARIANPDPYGLEPIDSSPTFRYRKGEDLANGIWIESDDDIYLRCPVRLCSAINEVSEHHRDCVKYGYRRTEQCIVCFKCQVHFWVTFSPA